MEVKGLCLFKRSSFFRYTPSELRKLPLNSITESFIQLKKIPQTEKDKDEEVPTHFI